MCMFDTSLRQRYRMSCGATCIAVRAGLTLDQAERLNGKRGTTTKKLAAILRCLGILAVEPLVRVKPGVGPEPGDICKVRTNGRRNWHWVIKMEGDQYYNPSKGVVNAASFKPGYVSAFLPVLGTRTVSFDEALQNVAKMALEKCLARNRKAA